MNRYRRFVTSSVAFTFVVVAVTGVIFKLFFKNHPLEEIHGWIGLALVAAAIPHIAQNWTALRSYLRDRRVYALTIPIVLVIAVFAFGEQREGGDRINPREIIFKLSNANTTDLAKVFGKDPAAVFISMKTNGLRVTNANETLRDLAQSNNRPPESLFSYFTN